MIRVDTKSGHGAGKPTTKIVSKKAYKQAANLKEIFAYMNPRFEVGIHNLLDRIPRFTALLVLFSHCHMYCNNGQ